MVWCYNGWDHREVTVTGPTPDRLTSCNNLGHCATSS